MTTSVVSRLLAPLLLFFPASSLLHGQIFPEDIRLSHDVEQMVLPEDARIQSAARIGDLTLVVWGSSRKVTDDSVANVLYWQILRDTVKLGEPQRLTDDRFDPFRFVQVLSLNDRFLVVWNDRRDGRAQAWQTIVDTAGSVGEMNLLWGGHPLTKGGMSVVEQTDGQFLIWNDTANRRIVGRRVDRIGEFLGEAFSLADGQIGDIIMDLPESGRILIDRGDRLPLFIDSIGTVTKPEGRAAEKFTRGYYIDDDGSVLTIRNDTVLEYASLADTSPIRYIPFALPRTLKEWGYGHKTLRGAEFVTRSRSGKIRVYFIAYAVDNAYEAPDAYAAIFALEEQDSAGFSDPLRISNMPIASGSRRDYFIVLSAAALVQRLGCKGYLVSLDIEIESSSSYQGQGYVDTIVRNTYTTILNDTIKWYYGQYEPLLPEMSILLERCCPTPSEVLAKRYLSKQISHVNVSLDLHVVAVTAPAAHLVASVPHSYPAITRFGDSLVFSSLSLGVDSTAIVGSWSGHVDESLLEYSSLPINLPLLDDTLTYTDPRLSVQNLGGTYVLHHYQPQILENLDRGAYSRTTRFNNVLYLLRPEGWKKIGQASGLSKTHMYYPFAMARDPDDRRIVVTFGWLGIGAFRPPYGASGITVFAFDESGDSLWKIDSLQSNSPSGFVVPLEDNRFVVIGQNKTHSHYNGRSLLYQNTSPSITDASWVIEESQVLGGYVFPNSTGTVRLELIDTSGAIVQRRDVNVGPDLNGFTVLVDPKDSGLILLYADKHIIGTISFDKYLNEIERRQISAPEGNHSNPAGAFRNDTLFVVWEDYRNGNAEIYANAVVPKTRGTSSSVAAETMRTGNLIASVSPNPAYDAVTIRLTEAIGYATRVELWSLPGSRVLEEEIPVGSGEIVLNVEALPEGAYVLLAKGDGRLESRMMMITR